MTDRYSEARARMVREQLERRGISDARVLAAMGELPRERFLGERPRLAPSEVYRDGALPVGREQTLSQPYMVGLMTEALGVGEGDRILEVGTGTGYQTAVLSSLAAEVWTVERDPELAEEARLRLHELGFRNIRFRTGDGSLGWPEGAPYDGILVTAGAPRAPASLLEQLAPGGQLVIPIGPREMQELVRITRNPDGTHREPEPLVECRFVPLVGEEGWASGDLA